MLNLVILINSTICYLNIFLVYIISYKLPPTFYGCNTCRTYTAKWIEHNFTLKCIKLYATVWKLDWKRSWMTNTGCRFCGKIPSTLCKGKKFAFCYSIFFVMRVARKTSFRED